MHDANSSLDGAMNHGHKQTDVIIMDFEKAFDKVPHMRLLHKLDYYGIRGSAHKWISSWLSGRSQQRKRAKIRNRYNQAPHLTQDTNIVLSSLIWSSFRSSLCFIRSSLRWLSLRSSLCLIRCATMVDIRADPLFNLHK